MKLLLLSFPLLWITAVSAIDFTDESEFPAWAEEAIEIVQEEGIMTGYGDGRFGVNDALTRAEAVTLILRTKQDVVEQNYNGIPQFPDVADGTWYEDAIGIAAAYGWVQGHDDGNFYPGNNLTRAEFSTLLARVFDLEAEEPNLSADYSDVESDLWFTSSISAMLENDLIRNRLSINYQPGTDVSRGEAAWTFAQLINKPGLIGVSGEVEIDSTNSLNSRRVAIKPRDFDAEKQGFDIERAAIHVDAVPTETEAPLAFNLSSDWQQLGLLRFRNSFDYRADLESFRLRLRLDADDMGPEEGFLLKIEGPDIMIEEKIYPNGELAVTGLEKRLEAGDEIVLKVSIKGDVEESFFTRTATGKVFLIEATGEAFKEFVSDSRSSDVRVAPIEYGDRDLSNFVFEPTFDE